jgi:hypothetical protein
MRGEWNSEVGMRKVECGKEGSWEDEKVGKKAGKWLL